MNTELEVSCHGTSFPLTEGLSTSPHLPRYLSDRSHDLWTVYIARPLWPLLLSFPLYATTVLSPKSYSSPRDISFTYNIFLIYTKYRNQYRYRIGISISIAILVRY
jgi:hypothetical protein